MDRLDFLFGICIKPAWMRHERIGVVPGGLPFSPMEFLHSPWWESDWFRVMLMILAAAFWGALFYFFSDKTVESPGGYREKNVEHPGEAGITHVEDERDHETVCVLSWLCLSFAGIAARNQCGQKEPEAVSFPGRLKDDRGHRYESS